MIQLPEDIASSVPWKVRKETLFIVIDSSGDPDHKKTTNLTAHDITARDRRKGYLSGCHNYVILRDGTVHNLRRMDAPGAAVRGLNHLSVTVCIVGGTNKSGEPEPNYTLDQWDALEGTVHLLKAYYPVAHVVGFGDLPKRNSSSPGFDVYEWAGHVGIENVPMETHYRLQKERWDEKRTRT